MNENVSSHRNIPQNGNAVVPTNIQADVRLPLAQTVSFQNNGLKLSFTIPENWIDRHIADPDQQIAFDYQERSSFLLVYSPFYNASFTQVPDDPENAERMYVSAEYFLDTGRTLAGWYGEHRKELVHMFGQPFEEKNVSIDGTDAKSITFHNEHVLDPVNNRSRLDTLRYVYLSRAAKIYEIKVDAPSKLYDHFSPTMGDIVQSVRL